MYRLYKSRYPDHSSPAHSLFPHLYKNLHNFGSFIKPKHKTCTVNNDENAFAVLTKFIENPQISLRTVAGISIK